LSGQAIVDVSGEPNSTWSASRWDPREARASRPSTAVHAETGGIASPALMRDVTRAGRSSVRDELAVIGVVPTMSKLYRPSPGVVARSALVERVRAAHPDVITVTAPAGYGKSTFAAELTSGDRRPTAWVSLSAAEDDPAALLTYVALALDDIEPIDPGCVSALWARSPKIGTSALQQFGAMLAGRRQPFTLVLDDVHELVSRDVLDTLPVLVGELPRGSTIVLASRRAIPLPLGRLRVSRRLVEIGPAELAFDAAEAALIFDQLGLDVSPTEIAGMVERTEGWPVALYLAALALSAGGGAMPEVVGSLPGDHRYLAEYFGEELLAKLDADVASFLMEASCLERISGSCCDEVLQRRGSAALLEALQQRTLLVIPLDDRRESYRFHHLMSEFLQSELRRRDPGRRDAVHLRASDWCDANGDGDGAVMHALRGGDLDRAESMVLRWFGTVGTANRPYPTTERWVALFSAHDIGDRPLLMTVAAWSRFGTGEPGVCVQWLRRAAASLHELHPDDVHGTVAPVGLALARALIEPLTPAEMATEARYVHEHVGLGEGHPMSCLAWGAAEFMLGDEAEAVQRLREGADTTLARPLPVGNCLAHLAVIDIEHGRWAEATDAARRARALLDPVAGFPLSVLVLAVSVLVETHAGRAADAEADRLRCRHLLIDLLDTAPWLNLQARIALARAAVLVGDGLEAAALLDEAEEILDTTAGALRVAQQVAAIRHDVMPRDRSQRCGPSSLTTAERRVLQLLPTHLTVAEIADRLYVSRSTVKTQASAIYSKLGTSSRGGAVEAAVSAGLLDTAARYAGAESATRR
jgi:LuxR family maltose regulon positive regulatory protein